MDAGDPQALGAGRMRTPHATAPRHAPLSGKSSRSPQGAKPNRPAEGALGAAWCSGTKRRARLGKQVARGKAGSSSHRLVPCSEAQHPTRASVLPSAGLPELG